MALAITPQGEFGYLPNFGKDSNRGARPWLAPVLIAEEIFWQPEAGILNCLDFLYVSYNHHQKHCL